METAHSALTVRSCLLTCSEHVLLSISVENALHPHRSQGGAVQTGGGDVGKECEASLPLGGNFVFFEFVTCAYAKSRMLTSRRAPWPASGRCAPGAAGAGSSILIRPRGGCCLAASRVGELPIALDVPRQAWTPEASIDPSRSGRSSVTFVHGIPAIGITWPACRLGLAGWFRHRPLLLSPRLFRAVARPCMAEGPAATVGGEQYRHLFLREAGLAGLPVWLPLLLAAFKNEGLASLDDPGKPIRCLALPRESGGARDAPCSAQSRIIQCQHTEDDIAGLCATTR